MIPLPSAADEGTGAHRRHGTAIAVGALVGAAIGVLMTFGIAARSGDPSTLIHFAPPNTESGSAPSNVAVLPETRGYDGQFYFRLTVAPLSTDERVDGVRLDHPALRMTRIGYPTLARLLTLGPADVVDAMLLANVAAYALLGAGGVSLAAAGGRRPFVGLALTGVPAFIYGTTMSVTDTLAGALIVVAIAMLARSRLAGAAVVLSAAALTRETALLFPAVVLAAVLWTRLCRGSMPAQRGLLLVGGLPFLAAIAWQLVVWNAWASIGPLDSGSTNLTLPFLGPFSTEDYFTPATSEDWMNILVPGATMAVVAMAAVALIHGELKRSGLAIQGAFVVATIIAVSVGPALLETYRSAVRGMGDAVLFGVVGSLFGRGRWSTSTLLAVSALGVVLMAWELRIAPDLS